MSEPEDPLDDALAGLPREDPLPAALETRVVGALRAEGLLGARRSPLARVAAPAAALVLGLAGGWLLRPALEPGPQADPGTAGTAQFLLLLGDGGGGAAPEIDVARSVAEHGAWAARLHREGRLVAAEKLAAGGRRIEAAGAGPVPLVRREGDEALLGFFLIRARDLDEALELARDCPNLRYGGSVTVRPVDPT